MAATTRDAGIDVVRSIGIVAIVVGHVWIDEPVHVWLYSWHVPVFFFLSGYLVSRRRSVLDEARTRWRSLGRPYVFWFAVIAVIYVPYTLTTGPSVENLLGPVYGGVFAHKPFTAFWFVFTLFAVAVLWRVLQSAPRWVLAASLVVALAASILAGEFLASTPLAIGSAVPALLFVAAGGAARRIEPRLSPRWRAAIGAALLLVAAAMVATGAVPPLDIKQGDWGMPVLTALNATAISWGLVLLARAVDWGRAGAVLTGFARIGFVVILTHGAILWALFLIEGFDKWAALVIALVGSTVIGLVVARTPAAEWATGMPGAAVRSHPIRFG
ncbi:acyltransferase family protein [Microbacterium sp. EYE_5]|uniref:acyltransferase family protein n=1 Tax=unclassified Microbacterium TaxID=2609290 RepID=UPI00200308CA|nr:MULTISPECIES: acyltransferase family protein [unclassified Microbacterium]MCK6079035.1 acyltransferase family protein [Microbacterium sp. EYE_382]MCK6084305.1 acyltransferase family protein [Microbacterium sp. EYE_384]MCK6123466.1 acyltransferase family protein [Microbacterium sp. EYE_80]MCK6125069.1 acyltransferase family protein [Microbacterium sp. EYE_79]MCK6139989.1 acyltransferase family protein [Microbacterium sp. EYE_39]